MRKPKPATISKNRSDLDDDIDLDVNDLTVVLSFLRILWEWKRGKNQLSKSREAPISLLFLFLTPPGGTVWLELIVQNGWKKIVAKIGKREKIKPSRSNRRGEGQN